MQVLPSEESGEASAALTELIGKLSPGNRRWPDAIFTDGARLWSALAAGQWTLIGAPGAADPDEPEGLSLTDLAQIAESWGRCARPVPFTPTMLVRRWAWAPEAAAERPLTFGLAAGEDSFVPFAGFPGVTLLTSAGVVPHQAAGLAGDDFDPLMPVSLVPERLPALSPAQVTDVCVLALAEAVGVAAGILADTVEHAKSREQFGRPIGSFQAVKHHCANMHIDVEIARSALGWLRVTRAAPGDGPEVGPDVGPGLADAFDRLRRVAETGVQVHGAMGFTWEAGLHYGLRHLVGLGEFAIRAASSTRPA